MRFSEADSFIGFRQEVREFIGANMPKDLAVRAYRSKQRSDIELWSRQLAKRGWLAPQWPLKNGGLGWNMTKHYVLQEELYGCFCPEVDRIALEMVGPIICEFGTEAQKKRYLPKILNGEELWCQGFSEPGAGSDLSNIRTSAVRERSDFIVTGHKVWTTQAHIADMMFALVKIAGPSGLKSPLSFVLIDMRSPGVLIRPIGTIDGRRQINEVFLENVRVPSSNIVGKEGMGWVYARDLLGRERIVTANLARTRRDLDVVKAVAGEKQYYLDGESKKKLTQVGRRILDAEIELSAARGLLIRLLSLPLGHAENEQLAPMLKVAATQLLQNVSEIAFDLVGERGVRLSLPEHATEKKDDESVLLEFINAAGADYLFRRSATIAGGTSEIQKNIIAAQVL